MKEIPNMKDLPLNNADDKDIGLPLSKNFLGRGRGFNNKNRFKINPKTISILFKEASAV